MPAKLMPLLVGTKAATGVAATTGLLGAKGAFTLTQSLMTAAKIGSGLMSLQAGAAQQQAYFDQAQDEKIRANEEAIQRREQLVEALAQQSARTGAAGITSVGTPEHIKATDITKFEAEEKRSRLASGIRQKSLERQGKSARAGKTLGAGIDLISYGADLRNIG